MRIAIIGSGDLGKQMVHFIQLDSNDQVVCFFDDFKVIGDQVQNIPIIGGVKDISMAYKNNVFDQIICAIGYNHLNTKDIICTKLIQKGIPLYTFVHSSVIVDKTAIIKSGCFIYPGCIIDQGVTISENSILNLGCIISHDTVIGKTCFIAPNVSVAGFCSIGNCCNIGISTTIIDNLKINDNTVLGASSLVIKSIIEQGTYVGSPCYKIK